MDPMETFKESLEYLTKNQLKSLYWKNKKPGYQGKKKAIAEAIAVELSRRAYGKRMKKFVKEESSDDHEDGHHVVEDKPADNPNQDRAQNQPPSN